MKGKIKYHFSRFWGFYLFFYLLIGGFFLLWSIICAIFNLDFIRSLKTAFINKPPADQEFPKIYGDTIVWMDMRNANRDIYSFDVKTEKEIPLSKSSIPEGMNGWLGIYGNKVVWYALTLNGSQLNIYDLRKGKIVKKLKRKKLNSFYSPSIWDDRVVWVDERNGNADIYLFVLTQNREIPICTNPHWQEQPAIWGDKIVWVDNRRGEKDIYLFDLRTGEEKPICLVKGEQFSPAIWRERVVWEDFRNGNWDIYLYDLSEKKEIPVCTHPADQTSPAICGNKVVWVDFREDAEGDIYLYDLERKKEIAICKAPGAQADPAIWEDRVVWSDHREGNWDIYMKDLKSGKGVVICNKKARKAWPWSVIREGAPLWAND